MMPRRSESHGGRQNSFTSLAPDSRFPLLQPHFMYRRLDGQKSTGESVSREIPVDFLDRTGHAQFGAILVAWCPRFAPLLG